MIDFMKSEYQKLNDKLNELGVPNHEFLSVKGTSVDTLVNTKWPRKPYAEILLEYLPKLSKNEQETVVRALSVKGNNVACNPLLEMFYSKETYSKTFLWVVGNALSIINDKSSYPEIIEICKNQKNGIARQMLFLMVLPRIKTDEAYQVLLDGLNDKDVKGHALDGLGKFGNIDAIDVIENIEVEKGKNEFKAKERALKKLRKKLEQRKVQ
ncbi:HEAT repeat domain-containing protein [Flavobacteriaceae bacterium 3-367]|uniref:HEAT repeat domain-containing protein n=1 Tax=Eudoraea algarum TaxID=3417568 RepID=UPI00327A0743